MRLVQLIVFLITIWLTGCTPVNEQRFRYLEEVEGEAALDWVRKQNKRTLDFLESDPRYPQFLASADKIVNAKDRIAYGQYRGGAVYNFWQGEGHVRGLIRRSTLSEFTKKSNASPGDINWETILDVDELAKSEGENWVYKGSVCLEPGYKRCLIRLSRGGTDASVYREFDMAKKEFVEGGFVIPEAKSGVAWVDEDTLLVGTDWGPQTLTKSGYPKQTRLWKRGQPLNESALVFEGEESDVGVWPATLYHQGPTNGAQTHIQLIIRATTFYTNELVWVDQGRPHRLELPDSVEVKGLVDGELLLALRKEWRIGSTVYPSGSLVSIPFNHLMKGDFGLLSVVWTPTARSSLEQVAITKNALYFAVLEDVKTKIHKWTLQGATEQKRRWNKEILSLPGAGTARIVSAYPSAEVAFLNFESFTTPDQLLVLRDQSEAQEQLKQNTLPLIASLPARFNAEGTRVEQRFAKSRDGTEVPYFLVLPKGFKSNGKTPTLLYGYGGFEISLTPSYRATYGKLWLERGGAYAIANIRGGGEFGPRWHQAALKENRQRAYDDFAAIAEDLIGRQVTTSDRLGIMGGSNGGLLVGVTFTQRPELFKAVVCQVPLLDMLRYTKLLAGASWIGEYGDPDNAEMRSHIQRYSPFHNLSREKNYPKPFFVTSTKDDRVHPGHARKMAAKMMALGHPVYYFENIEGGHGASANLKQAARRTALEFIYLSRELGLE